MSLIIVTPILSLLIIIISYFRMPCILTGPGGHHRSSAVNLLHISLPCRRLCHDLWEWRLTPSVTRQHNVCFVWATPSEVFSMHSSPPCGREGESAAAGDKLISTPFSPHTLHPPPTTKKIPPPPQQGTCLTAVTPTTTPWSHTHCSHFTFISKLTGYITNPQVLPNFFLHLLTILSFPLWFSSLFLLVSDCFPFHLLLFPQTQPFRLLLYLE